MDYDRKLYRHCPNCDKIDGTDFIFDTRCGDGNCNLCNGTGEIDNLTVGFQRLLGQMVTLGLVKDETDYPDTLPCPRCHASGQCQTCGGEGMVKRKRFEVHEEEISDDEEVENENDEDEYDEDDDDEYEDEYNENDYGLYKRHDNESDNTNSHVDSEIKRASPGYYSPPNVTPEKTTDNWRLTGNTILICVLILIGIWIYSFVTNGKPLSSYFNLPEKPQYMIDALHGTPSVSMQPSDDTLQRQAQQLAIDPTPYTGINPFDSTVVKTSLVGKSIFGKTFQDTTEIVQTKIINQPDVDGHLINEVTIVTSDNFNVKLILTYENNNHSWNLSEVRAIEVSTIKTISPDNYVQICPIENCSWTAENLYQLSWKIDLDGDEYISGPQQPRLSLPSSSCYFLKSNEVFPVKVKFIYHPLN